MPCSVWGRYASWGLPCTHCIGMCVYHVCVHVCEVCARACVWCWGLGGGVCWGVCLCRVSRARSRTPPWTSGTASWPWPARGPRAASLTSPRSSPAWGSRTWRGRYAVVRAARVWQRSNCVVLTLRGAGLRRGKGGVGTTHTAPGYTTPCVAPSCFPVHVPPPLSPTRVLCVTLLQRIPCGFQDRTLPHFLKSDLGAPVGASAPRTPCCAPPPPSVPHSCL